MPFLSPSAVARLRPRSIRRFRTAALLGASLLGSLGFASPALASHLQGGFFTANVTAGGRLQGTITYLEVTACPSGVGSQKLLPITIKSPGGQVVSKNVSTTATRCLTGGSTYEGSFDYPLDTTTFSAGAPDGNYLLEWTAGNRVAGIVNLANSSTASVRFRAQVHKDTGVATGAPNLGSDVATGVGVGELYSQNLNASDPDDLLGIGTLTYQALTGLTDLAPDSNVINTAKLAANGQVEIPVGTTSGFSNGQRYIYKVRVTDDQGDYAERDVLLKAVTPNHAPVISGLDTVNGYDIAAGATQTINFTATDPDGANTVALSGAGLPSWATLTPTPGNPASGTLTLSPPAGANTRDFHMSFDAVDNDSTQPLTGSALIEVRVAGTPETQLLTKPAALTTSTSATFTFRAANPGYTFECSLDGGTNWSVCTSGVSYTGLSDGPKTFQVRANDGTQVDPTPASYTWTIDTTPPTTTIATHPAAATSSTTANFTFTSNETGAVTYECKLDGGSFAACTTPKSYTGLADGSHTLSVRATDTLGHLETTPVDYTWVIDRTAPDSTILTGPTLLSNTASATFTFSSTEPGSTYQCNLDSAGWVACTDPQAYAGLADGSHTLQMRSVDAAGNADASPASYTWAIDTLAPSSSIPSGPAALTSATTAHFTLSSDDGAATFECKVDGGSWAPCTSPVDLTGLADGDHHLLVRTTDAAGNVDLTPATYDWTVDTGAPSTTITSHPAAHSGDTAPSFAFSSADGTATFECKLDAGSWAPCTSPYALTGLTDGDHTLQVRATDTSGNVEATPATYTWNVDSVAPAAPSFDQAPAAQASSSNFVFGHEPGATVECQIDGGSWVVCANPFAPTLADGPHTLRVRQTDEAGNVSPVAERSWTLDTAAPESPVVVSGPTGSTTARGAAFEFTAEPGTTVECRLDGGDWTTCASPLTYANLPIGDHVLELRSTDGAGNVSGTHTERWSVVAEPVKGAPAPAKPTTPAPTAVRVDVSKSVSVDPKKSTVGCRLEGVNIDTCVVGIYAKMSDLGLAAPGSPEDKLVRIGTGRATADGKTGRVGVKVVLNATGKAAMERVGGVRARVNIKATDTGGQPRYAHKYTTIRPATQLVVPSDGLFPSNSAAISLTGKRYLQSIGLQLGAAKSVKCIGHTDSLGAANYNARLGLARAKAVCDYLGALHVTAPKKVATAGETKPRATNQSAAGRALNRRVELSLRYG